MKRSFFVGGGVFDLNGSKFLVPGGRVATDEVLAQFAPEDRTNIILAAQKQGVVVEAEYVEPLGGTTVQRESDRLKAEIARLTASRDQLKAEAERSGVPVKD